MSEASGALDDAQIATALDPSAPPVAAPPDDPASKIGRFVVLREIGAGAMGVVHAGFDLQLDRKVAIKVLRADLQTESLRTRALREAQALAKLSHANVVQVYEVGEHRRQLFVAMEFVDGLDLRRWLVAETRPWPLVLATVAAAGRGLAAAHALGLVHRDVKPDNILVGKDGRARIADFGLVRSVADEVSEVSLTETAVAIANARAASGSSPSWQEVELTAQGRTVGTAAYMSPEQHIGHAIDARADQFSFCVTLYEALYRVRPFTGKTWKALRAEVMRGQIPPPPRGSRVPRWIHRAIVRGLDPDPERRWPDMSALLDALADDPRRRRQRIVLALGAGVAIAALTYRVTLEQASVASRCAGGLDALGGAWDDERRRALRAEWEALGDPIADEGIDRVVHALDAYADRWAALHKKRCEDQQHGRISSHLFDRSASCLNTRRTELDALVGVLEQARGDGIRNAAQAVTALPRIDRCADDEALLAAVPPPEDASMRAEVDALRALLARARALEADGRYDDGLALLAEIRPRVDATAYPPLQAEALLALGRIHLWRGDADPAATALRDALVAGLAARTDAVASEALARWVYVVGYQQGRPTDAIEWEPIGRALAQRANDGGESDTLLTHNLGAVLTDEDPARALTLAERALAGWTALGGPQDPQALYARNNIANAALVGGECARARAEFEALRDVFIAVLGPAHPNTVLVGMNQCLALDCLNERDEATACRLRARSELRRSGLEGTHFDVMLEVQAAMVALDDRDETTLRALLARARAIDGAAEVPEIRLLDGHLALLDGDLNRSLAAFHDLAEGASPRTTHGALARIGLAEVHLARGHVADAGHQAEALLAAIEPRRRPHVRAGARFVLARALAADPDAPDRARALDLARAASADLASLGHAFPGERRRIDAWIEATEQSLGAGDAG